MNRPASEEIVTLIIKHRIKAGFEAEYDVWLRETVTAASQHPGHLGVDVIRGKQAGLQQITCILRFCSSTALQGWIDSEERARRVKAAEHMFADGDQIEVNPIKEFWFTTTDESSPPPPRWKQACVTFFVILPHTLLVPILWGPVFKLNAWLANYVVGTILVTVTIVVSVVYLFMPIATRLFASWLSPSKPSASDDGVELNHEKN
ncbi:antibiotic biosynthesis monooxygenase [Pseudomonas sp. NA-150]|uniref:antibiotic biosynthesis monooxygenase n=1 Tax=Pseudomonas sp. NA-150 TaxID=3367525 RepID=UPI0037CB39AE